MNVKLTKSSLAPGLVSMASVPSDHNHSDKHTSILVQPGGQKSDTGLTG